ncbi:hypothetical protein P389DRAFT_22468 [Cystobasidium minutum MCA 4210]|uniref:uncharacterized protein n=1 Tax=Cystobasidium minutum MCA 4210 TaxID=1397322 RepID=UPI0034CEC369|eukprot:jgi/Rhomi1/22468/CE22467_22
MDIESGMKPSRTTRAQHKNRSPTLSVWPRRFVPEGRRVSYNLRQVITIDVELKIVATQNRSTLPSLGLLT